jgi:hypothetical protein
MRRRELIAGIGAAVAYPLTTQAQRGERVRLVAVLIGGSQSNPAYRSEIAALGEGLPI